MSIIQFKEANCKNCYKCIRSCPVKSISFNNEQAKILDDDCILCGNCYLVCPQNAKYIRDDTQCAKDLLSKNAKVYVSLAPSYIAAFPGANIKSMSAALKKLGFIHVEETIIGAGAVSVEYARLMKEHKMKNIITTACPSIFFLVQKYYPDLVPFLAPVVSPMIAHARILKEVYGSRVKVVFIGPCISKKKEIQDPSTGGLVSCVLTFDELSEWLKEENITIGEEDPDCREPKGYINRLYPTPEGIIQTIKKEDQVNYKCLGIDGVDRCMEVLNSLRDNPDLSDFFLEFNACPGSCIEGPVLKKHQNTSFLSAKDAILKTLKANKGEMPPLTEETKVDFSRHFFDCSIEKPIPDEATIRSILASIGKTTPEAELNCSGCGYPSCREKAIAVYQGKADLKMCLPYMRERAESMSNIIIDHTPNGIISLDNDLNILSYNSAAEEMFHVNLSDFMHKSVSLLLGDIHLEDLAKNELPTIDEKYYYNKFSITVEQTLVYISEHKTYIFILKDISAEEKNLEKISKVRSDTISVAQKVIDKQMRVAQEIASLLGETTAETKVALTNFKKSILADTDEEEK